MQSMHSGEVVPSLDSALVLLAVEDASSRLRLGQALEQLGRGGHCDLGFASMAAYVVERCERSVRWVQAARALARGLEALPAVRRALAFGRISWSQAEVLVGAATPGTEAAWLEAAQGCTVRELRSLARAVLGGGTPANETTDDDDSDGDEELCTLTCTVDREDAWLFEATQQLLVQLGAQARQEQIEALLAESQATLLALLPRGTIDPEDWERVDAAGQQRREQLARFRAEAERCREARVARRSNVSVDSAAARAAASGCASLQAASAVELDALVREMAGTLARREVALARHIFEFHRLEGWHSLGYATEAQYARERLGMSRSSWLARCTLARRLERLPRVAEALELGHIGVESALQVVRVAGSSTEAAWLERARRRTVKHLREEVVAALVARRVAGETECAPPLPDEMNAFHELERAVVSGRACQGSAWGVSGSGAGGGHGAAPVHEGASGAVKGGRDEQAESARVESARVESARVESARVESARVESASEQRKAWRVMLSSLSAWLERGVASSVQMSAAPAASAGRVPLRLRVSRATYRWWRGLERCARRWLPEGMSWLKFMCLCVWRAWQHLLGASVAYGRVYVRDRFRCTSPVCSRRDVTPHHLRFRSAGGSDADENVVALCVWCHLFGIHGGRIRASGTAGQIEWELGPRGQPCVVVSGRERRAA